MSVAKGKLLASIAVAGREAGLLSEWGSGAEKFVFECIILSCVVEGVVRRFGFVVSAIDCRTEEVEFVVDGGDFGFLNADKNRLLTVDDDYMRSESFTIVR